MDAAADPAFADTLAHLADHLSGPLVGGMVLDEPRLDEAGRIVVGAAFPAALLTVATAFATRDGSVVVSLSRSRGAEAPEAMPELRFPPWSEALGYLPAGLVAAGDRLVATAIRDGAPVAAAELAALVRLRLVGGNLARLLLLMKREAPRIRREAAAIRASRQLRHATGYTLDRLGRDIAAPRFVTGEAREADEAYRSRLAVLRPFAAATRRALEDRLGPGLAVVEQPTGLAAALRLIAVGARVEEARDRRRDWLSRLAAARLVDPVTAPDATAILPSGWREERARRAERLATFLTFDEGAPRLFAGPLVDRLERLARLAAAAGVPLRLAVRTPPEGADPGLDLGLGLVVAAPSAADRAALAPHLPAGFDPAEPSGAGLFAAADLSARALDAGTVLLTTLPSDLVIDGPDATGLRDGSRMALTLRRVRGEGTGAATPPVGGRPAERAFFRIGVMEGPRPLLRQQGRTATLRLRGPGVYLIVAHALVRTGGTDPFEARVVATDPALRLDLAAWERLVETLRRMRPVGIAIDTWTLRKDHVRLDDAPVDPSDVRLRRGVRPWRMPRLGASLPLSADDGS